MTISMVLVYEDDVGTKHLIYYFSYNLNDIEVKYTHVEKLALEVVQVVQRFHQYILLQKNMVISLLKPHDVHIIAIVSRGK